MDGMVVRRLLLLLLLFVPMLAIARSHGHLGLQPLELLLFVVDRDRCLALD